MCYFMISVEHLKYLHITCVSVLCNFKMYLVNFSIFVSIMLKVKQ